MRTWGGRGGGGWVIATFEPRGTLFGGGHGFSGAAYVRNALPCARMACTSQTCRVRAWTLRSDLWKP